MHFLSRKVRKFDEKTKARAVRLIPTLLLKKSFLLSFAESLTHYRGVGIPKRGTNPA